MKTQKTHLENGKVVFAPTERHLCNIAGCNNWNLPNEPHCVTHRTLPATKHHCQQCNKDMGFEWLLGPVCGSCCRKNHRKVAGR